MATTIGIVYAAGSKAVRRIISPDNDAQLTKPGLAGAGETLLIAPKPSNFNVQKPDLAYCKAQVKTQTGIDPPNLTCAVIDNTNTVRAIIAADPALDSVSGMTVVGCYSPQIAAGCTYDPASGLFTAPAVTIPAGTNKVNGKPVASQIIPAAVIPKP
jgi:hypothetical protein